MKTMQKDFIVQKKGSAGMMFMLLAVLLMQLRSPVLGQTAFDPQAVTVMEKYIEATGGRSTFGKITNRVTTATIEIASQGIVLNATIYMARPNKAYTVIESDITGKMESGTDGEVVWEKSAMRGAIVKEGKERESMLGLNTFDRMVDYKKHFTSIQSFGKEKGDEGEVHKLAFYPVQGDSFTSWFDAESFLMKKMEMTMQTDMGAIPVVSTVEDYRDVNGILIPHQTTVQVMGQIRISRIEKIEQNVDLPDDLFKVPEDIRAIMEK